ncbi:MAG: T9SS type A sorting domain-containing protein [Candidatus Sabulitectum sp.]|nr:T9SS type A sorting domain-containing protein [Candidatus Sabulitectum sp.]
MRPVLLMVLLSALAFADGAWEVIQHSPSATLTDMSFLPDGLHGWTVGGVGDGVSSIYRTADAGTSWEAFTISGSIRAVHFVSADSGWVVGDGGAIKATIDGGDNWTTQSSGTTRLLASVHFINHLEGWACGGWQSGGSSYLILHTSDGGVSWQDQSFGSNAYSCEDIWFTDSMNGWVGGRTSTLAPHIYHTTDGGETWTSQTVPFTSGNAGICSIDFATADIGWAATTSLTDGGPVLYTGDGGASWSVQTYSNLYYHRVAVLDENHVAVVAVKTLPPAQVKIMVTSNGGQSWSSTTLPIIDYTYALQYANNDIWVGSGYSQILRSTDNGSTWEWQNRSPIWKSISWVNEITGRITSGSSAGTDGYSIITEDGGASWDDDANSPGGAQCLFTDTDTGWLLWEGTNSKVWRTTDGGADWTLHNITNGPWIGGFFFASADSGWAFGSEGALKFTSDGGVNWTTQSLSTTRYVAAVNFVDTNEGWAAGGYGGASGFIRHTIDGGANWTVQTPASTSHILGLFFLNSLEGWAAGCGGEVQKTTDGGTTWVSAGTLPHEYAEKILMINSDTGWIIVNDPPSQGGRGYIYRTDNGGSSWTLEWSGTLLNEAIWDMAVQSDSTIWACGYHGNILKYVPGAGVETDPSFPESVLLHAAQPNPFSTSSVIRFETSAGGNVRLELFDISGRLVETMVDGWLESGTHQTMLRGGELAPGMYVYRIQAEGFVATEKCIVFR